jgi:hypothetical protein
MIQGTHAMSTCFCSQNWIWHLGSCLLLLLIGPLLLRKEPSVWLWCGGSQRGSRDSQRRWSALRQLCCRDGDNQGHHVTPPRNGDGNLPPPPVPLEVVSSSSADSSRRACSDNNPLWTIPTKMAPKPFPSRETLRLPEWSAMNSKVPKRMVFPGANPMLVCRWPSPTMMSFNEWTIRTFRRKHATNLPS